MTQKILVVDDEPMLTDLLDAHLTQRGYLVCKANNAEEALAKLGLKPDLILLDIGMPGTDGLQLCQTIRNHIGCPILFLTARIAEQDKIDGLAVGGDDYITKPFSLRELTARIEAHLRRAAMRPATSPASGTIAVGRLSLDMAQHRATLGGKPVALTPKEFKILATLAASPGTVLSREQLVEAAWGPEFVGETSSITVFIKKLRAKIEADPTEPRIIETVWGIGYRLDPEACG